MRKTFLVFLPEVFSVKDCAQEFFLILDILPLFFFLEGGVEGRYILHSTCALPIYSGMVSFWLALVIGGARQGEALSC